MKNLEPSIFRQRLIIEGHYSRTMDGETIREYIIKLSKVVEMTIFSGKDPGKPKIKDSFSPCKVGELGC